MLTWKRTLFLVLFLLLFYQLVSWVLTYFSYTERVPGDGAVKVMGTLPVEDKAWAGWKERLLLFYWLGE